MFDRFHFKSFHECWGFALETFSPLIGTCPYTPLLIHYIIDTHENFGYGITSHTLAELSGLSRETVRRRVNNMVKKGWVGVDQNPPDRRGKYYIPLEKLYEDVGPALTLVINRMIETVEKMRSN